MRMPGVIARVVLSALGFSLVWAPRAFAQADVADQDTTGAEIQDVVAQVKAALEETQTIAKSSGLPELESVTLTLQTGVSVSGEMKFTFLVISFGRKWSKETTQQVVLKLARPKAKPLGQTFAPPSITEKLAGAILSVARGIKGIETGKIPLSTSEVAFELSFVVMQSKQGGAKFSLVPIDVDFSGDLKKQAVHKIAVTFKRDQKP